MWMMLNALGPTFRGNWHTIGRAVAGPALAAFLLVIGGGVITHLVFGPSTTGFSLGLIADPGSRQPIGAFKALPGGIGLLGLGVVPAATIAVLLAYRQRLILALAAASGLFLLAAFSIQFTPAPHDISRFDGHSRNFALLALLFALAIQLSAFRPRWRYSTLSLIALLIMWPTIAAPVQSIALSLSQGPHLSNAKSEPSNPEWTLLGRFAVDRPPSDTVAAYIRTHHGR